MRFSLPGSPDDPHAAPAEPGGPASSTDVLERVEQREQVDPGDDERYAHYVRKDKITAAAVTGQPVIALCGKVWTPGRDPNKYPVCPTCKAIYEELGKGGGKGGDGSGGGRSWPFGFGRGGSSSSDA